ncbi:Mvb12, partial [Operophtera brumata]
MICKMVCYKVSGGSTDNSPTHNDPPRTLASRSSRPTTTMKRSVPRTTSSRRDLRRGHRLPSHLYQVLLSPLVSELNHLNLQSPAYPRIEEFTTDHDYEALSP